MRTPEIYKEIKKDGLKTSYWRYKDIFGFWNYYKTTAYYWNNSPLKNL